MELDVDRYLDRIAYRGPRTADRDTLEALQRAHMTAVPFENLHVFHQVGVRTDLAWSVPKVVEDRRGGWCFELNGAFGALLEALGFDVIHLGAAVLLGGPATLIDHLALEVTVDEPLLVDVGFGDGFIRPLALNRSGPQDGGASTFELLPSPQGTTLARHDVDGVPAPQYRFKRVAHSLDQFDEPSARLQGDAEGNFRSKRFATRLLDGGPDRVSLLTDRLKVTRDGATAETPVALDAWDDTLQEWFGLRVPAPPSA